MGSIKTSQGGQWVFNIFHGMDLGFRRNRSITEQLTSLSSNH